MNDERSSIEFMMENIFIDQLPYDNLEDKIYRHNYTHA